MNYFVPFSLIMLLNSARLQASDSTKICLHPVKDGTKWGYANNDGRCIIPFAFDSAWAFSEGLAAIELKNKWGFIDQSGKMVINPRFFHVESFSCGLAKVWIKNPKYRIAFIDTKGEIAFKCKYLDVTSFSFQRSRVFIHNKVCYLNRKGRIVIKTSFPYGGVFYEGIAQVWANHSAKFIDTNGRRIAFFYEMGHENFSEGTASVLGNEHSFYINRAGEKIKVPSRSFYIDTLGNPTITKTVDNLVYFPFSNGMAEVCIPGTDHKSGYIDSTGNLVIPIIYDEATPFLNSHAMVGRDGKSFIIDKKGNIIDAKDRRSLYEKCDCK
jgi:hypothetical protein